MPILGGNPPLRRLLEHPAYHTAGTARRPTWRTWSYVTQTGILLQRLACPRLHPCPFHRGLAVVQHLIRHLSFSKGSCGPAPHLSPVLLFAHWFVAMRDRGKSAQGQVPKKRFRKRDPMSKFGNLRGRQQQQKQQPSSNARTQRAPGRALSRETSTRHQRAPGRVLSQETPIRHRVDPKDGPPGRRPSRVNSGGDRRDSHMPARKSSASSRFSARSRDIVSMAAFPPLTTQAENRVSFACSPAPTKTTRGLAVWCLRPELV